MVEPNRLREGSDAAAKLLLAGMRDAPAPSAKRAVGRALGVSFVTVASATAANAGSRLVEAAATGSAAKVGFGVVAQWCAIGFVAGSIVSAGVVVPTMALQRDARSQAPPVTTPPITSAPSGLRPTAPATDPAAQTVSALGPSATPASERLAPPNLRREAEATATPARSAAPSPAPEALPSLSREVELLERVRQKLKAGDAAGALIELDRVEPNVVSLAIEAQLLRIEALLANGERERAEALAFELERRDPGGPLGFRLRRLLSAR